MIQNFDGAGNGIRTRGGLRQRILSPPPFPRGSSLTHYLDLARVSPPSSLFTSQLRHKCYLSINQHRSNNNLDLMYLSVFWFLWRYGYYSQYPRNVLAGNYLWAGTENYNGFLPKPSQDRARTAKTAGVSLLPRESGESSGSRVQIPSRPPSIASFL